MKKCYVSPCFSQSSGVLISTSRVNAVEPLNTGHLIKSVLYSEVSLIQQSSSALAVQN